MHTAVETSRTPHTHATPLAAPVAKDKPAKTPDKPVLPPPDATTVNERPPSRPTMESARIARQRNAAENNTGVIAHQLQAKASTKTPDATSKGGPNAAFDDVRSGQSGALLRSGSSGEQVRLLRQQLNDAGAQPPLPAGDTYDRATEDAVRRFQRQNGAKVDGIVGPETMGALDRSQGHTPHAAAAEATARYARRDASRGPRQPHVDPPRRSPQPTAPGRTDGTNPPARTDGPTAPTNPNAPTTPNAPAPTTPAPTGTLRGPHGATPARDLSATQARQELEALRAAGKINYTESNGRIRLTFPINGVNFKYPTRRSADSRSYGLDPRMAVATVRLADWAKSRGVTEIEHLGFGGRNGHDRHGQGRALDIGGFRGVDPQTGQAFDLNVQRDWGSAPRNGTGYRLDPNSFKGRFFQDAYQFMTREFRDTRGGSQIGGRSYIITPDHPTERLARTHSNHFHIEVPPQ